MRLPALPSIVLALLTPHFVMAQPGAARFVTLSANHALLTGLFRGADITTTTAGPGDKIAPRFGAFWLTAFSQRTGVACNGGPALPPGCVTEPIHDKERMFGLTFGVVDRLVERRRLAIAAVGDVSFGSIRDEARGRQTGNSYIDSRMLAGLRTGLEATIRPLASRSVAFVGAIHLGNFSPMMGSQALDSGTSFNSSFTAISGSIGASWWPGVTDGGSKQP